MAVARLRQQPLPEVGAAAQDRGAELRGRRRRRHRAYGVAELVAAEADGDLVRVRVS